MIAERPKEQASPVVEVDLFEGLSFPEVPSAPVAVSNGMQASLVTNLVLGTIPQPVNQISSPVTVVKKVEPTAQKTGNLSSLYSTAEVIIPIAECCILCVLTLPFVLITES